MISKRLTAVYIVFILMASIFPTISGSGGIPPAEASGFEPLFSGGSGTASDPYRISNVTELQWMGNTSNLNKHFVLVNDINASVTKTWNSGSGFVPIGTNAKKFTGSLDGKGYKITGLFISRSRTDYQGLFGYIGTGGVVNNVSLIDNDVTGRDCVGGLVGISDIGTVENCSATGTTIGNLKVGGLTGYNSGTMTNCFATGNTSGTMYSVGGLTGYNSGTMTNCFATGNTSGLWHVGGLVGFNNFYSTVSNCYATGNTSGFYIVGGLIGYYHIDSVILNSHYNINGSLINNDHYVTLGGLFNDQYQDWYSNGLSLKISDYNRSLVPNGTYYEISSVQGFKDLLGFADNSNYRFRLASDIDLSSAPGLYIPYFASREFDGGGHTISNLWLNQSFNERLGMLGEVRTGSTASNLKLMNTKINGYNYVGGLVGFNCGGTVTNCYAIGSTSGDGDVGGLLGVNYYGTVTECYSTGNTNGTFYVGGLVGSNYGGTVTNCYATGTASGTVNYANKIGGIGGFVGWNFGGTVTNCHATGNVSGRISVSGFVGYNDHGTVTNCFWDINTTGQSSSAGGTGKITSEMKTRTTFTNAGWDFDNIWCMIENTTYPFLRWQDTKRPIANAGPDMIVDVGALVAFDGSGSWDDMGIAIYEWSFTDEKPVTLYGAKPEYQFNNPGMFTITLNVQDAVDTWDSDTMKVTVLDNIRPVPDAGPDIIVDEGTVANFNGSGSYDNVGIVNYTWTFFDIEMVTLYGVDPSYLFENPGIYSVTLNVSDAAGHWSIDTMMVTVLDITRPMADAGPDMIVDEGTVVTLNGSGSYDNVGIVNYTWTFFDIEMVTLYGVDPSYLFENQGIYSVTLNVSDAAGRWSIDIMMVTVLDITRPMADAGPDLVVDEDSIVIFNGSGSYDNVGIVNYTWTFMDGDQVVLYGIAPEYVFSDPGIFIITLNISDDAGYWNTDKVTVTVNDITPPFASVGEDLVIDEGELVKFDPSSSYDNVGISNFTWTFMDGISITLYGSQAEHEFIVSGIFIVTLNVSDAAGNWATATMTVTVRDITSPVANAGSDQKVAVGTAAILNGSLSADNVGVVRYTWTFNYDGVERTLEGVSVQFKFEKAGTYEIKLMVFDEYENSGEDTVIITVIDTGIVKGTVLDDKGDPVEGAKVGIRASNGQTYSMTTGANGSFSIEVFYGDFTWTISKKGYSTMSGTGSVDAMGTTEIFLSGTPLMKEGTKGPSIILFIVIAVILMLIIIGIAIFLFTRKKKEEPSEEKEKMEDLPVEDKEADPSSEGSIPPEDPLSGGSPPEGSSQEDGGEMEHDPIVENGEGPVPEEEDPLSILDELVNTQKQDGDPGI